MRELSKQVDAKIRQSCEGLQTQMGRKASDLTTRISKIAGGDPTECGGDWLGEKTLEQWTCWANLKTHYKGTLRCLKATDLSAMMRECEDMFSLRDEFARFFSRCLRTSLMI